MAKLSKTLGLLLCALMGVAAHEPDPSSKCDINGAGPNVLFVQDIINQALGKELAVNDLNADGVVNVVDVEIELLAVAGFCSLDPHTYAIGGLPVSIENSFSPAPSGSTTLEVDGAPVSIENSFSPAPTGPMTFAVNGAPVSIENSISPAPASPQTYYSTSLYFSMFNGLVPTSLQSSFVANSLRFLVPVDRAFLREALARGAQRINGKPV